ncbi:MAG: NADH-quinone oxidoreductase subunit C [bacterium]
MCEPETISRINNFIEKKISGQHSYIVHSQSTDHRIEINPMDLVRVCRELKNTDPFYFLRLADITAVDFPKKDKRFHLNYVLYSFKLNHRLHLKLTTGREKDLPSLGGIWPIAETLENEITALFGLFFSQKFSRKNRFFKIKNSIYPLRKDFPAGARFRANNCKYNL